jgi:thiosulfate/3-mercaptopyruvate sulfurtransferase
MSFGLLAPLTLAALAIVSTMSSPPAAPTIRSTIRVVDVRGAASLVARGASVLDARDSASFATGHLPGAQLYAWSLFTETGAARGRLRRELAAIGAGLAALGVDESRPTLVYGHAGTGQGDEGHAAWLLALLGHPDVAMLDGGIDAWRSAGRPVVTSVTAPTGGRFTARLRSELRVDRAGLDADRVQVVDVRSASEFVGATVWGEARGGHVPGARHLDWRTVIDDHGRVRPAQRVREALDHAGVDAMEPIALVCSNGVRAGFVSAVLMARGIAIAPVYDGGMIDLAADPTRPLARG